MFGVVTRSDLAELLGALGESLDIPEAIDNELKQKYEEMCLWIRRENAERHRTDSAIYPQGSRRLGTIVSPVRAGQDYDFDIVYLRDLQRSGTSQRELKAQVGEQLVRFLSWLRAEGHEVPRLEEGTRCWTLRWGARFHMDILPALPGDEPRCVYLGENHILITDRELRNWQSSNPKGFAAWFRTRIEDDLRSERERQATLSRVDIEMIPEDSLKTPLQRVVQLLKRHRDLFYEGDPDDKPSSIIVTTLAAQSYDSQMSVYDAIMYVVPRMHRFVDLRDGVYWVLNPTNNEENFADRWAAQPQRAVRFFEWLRRVQADINHANGQQGIHKVTEALALGWGQLAATEAAHRYGDHLRTLRTNGALRAAAGSATLGTAGRISVAPHTFYGGKR